MSGVIRANRQFSFSERLCAISRALRELIEHYSPIEAAIEGVFHSVNARSALQLGHVRGVALLVVAEAQLPVREYSALQIKSSVVGYGRAEKVQVQEMVKRLLCLDSKPSEDAADALAVALCHGHHSRAVTQFAQSASKPSARNARWLASQA
jgi:crossover junction endodeoxyribonuclease RuvC